MSKFYLEQGFQAYIAKPIHSSLLEATLMQVLQPELIDKTQHVVEEEQLFVTQARKKRGIILTTDCACDLPQSMLDEYGIRMMHYYCETDEGRFRDLTEIDADNLLQYLAENPNGVSTMPASVTEYEHFFGDMLTKAEAVIHVSLGSGYDVGYERALHAAESFGNVHVFDSGTISSGLGLLVYRAAEYAAEGKTVQEVEAFLARQAGRVHAGFLTSNPGLMAKRFRGGALVKGISEVFRFEPAFHIKKGKIRLERYYMGYFSDNVEHYIKNTLRNVKNTEDSMLIIAHSGCSTTQREKIMTLVKKYGHFNNVIMQKASATISANCGAHAFGLFYIR